VATNDDPETIEDLEPDTGEPVGSGPKRGGCLDLGWGCLPVIVGVFVGVPAIWF
jgi:hypothetical protein